MNNFHKWCGSMTYFFGFLVLSVIIGVPLSWALMVFLTVSVAVAVPLMIRGTLEYQGLETSSPDFVAASTIMVYLSLGFVTGMTGIYLDAVPIILLVGFVVQNIAGEIWLKD